MNSPTGRSQAAHPARILIVDDDPLAREAVARRLTRIGYLAVAASPGEDAISARFDVVVLRPDRHMAVDDVVRVVSEAARSAGSISDVLKGPAGIEMHLRARAVWVEGRPVELTPKAFDVLRLLLERAGEVLSADQIALGVWGYTTNGSRNFVEAQISRVRSRLAAGGATDVIETIRGVGYAIRSGGRLRRAYAEPPITADRRGRRTRSTAGPLPEESGQRIVALPSTLMC